MEPLTRWRITIDPSPDCLILRKDVASPKACGSPERSGAMSPLTRWRMITDPSLDCLTLRKDIATPKRVGLRNVQVQCRPLLVGA
jgi:hypothetical protein